MKFVHAFIASLAALALAGPVSAQAPSFSASIVQSGQSSTLRSIVPQTRTAARAMGFGGVGQYAVLPGHRAMLRLTSNTPSFIVAAPDNIQPQGLFTVARFEARRNGTREVLIGGGYMSFTSGISADRVVQLNVVEAPDQSGRPAGTILYQLTPTAPLGPGEYALIAAGGQQGGGNMMSPAGLTGSFYDFGVD